MTVETTMEYRKLDDREIEAGLEELPGWTIDGGQLTRRYEFTTYKDGLAFAVAAGWAADRLNHHPDLHIGYGKVTVAMHTHDVGGLSPFDFELARRIDSL